EVAALAASGTSQAACEQGRLQKWLQAVSDRLCAGQPAERRPEPEDVSPSGITWQAMLTLDHLIRRLRIHKEPTRNQQRILEGAFRVAHVGALIWIPQQADAPILMQGEPLLSPPECRDLAAALAQHPAHQPLQ